MLGGLWTALLNWILGRIGLRRSAPSSEEIAASNATAQAELSQETARAEIIETAAAARSGAADGVVHVIAETGGAADPSPDQPVSAVNLALKRKFPDDFRD